MKYMIGVDIGTTSTKAVLYDEKGQFIMKHNIGYPLHTPNVEVSEENPDELFDAVLMTYLVSHTTFRFALASMLLQTLKMLSIVKLEYTHVPEIHECPDFYR